MKGWVVVVAAAALVVAPRAAGQACGSGRLDLTAALERIETAALAELKAAQDRREDAEQQPNPRAAKQVQAPSGASGSASPVDAPSLPELLSLAVDSKLLDLGNQQALSVSLNPFAFVALARPGMSEPDYQAYSWLRRLDGQLSLGGQGESFDRDGDGQADPALKAKALSDSVSWEVRLRVLGSRDRRERSFVERYAQAVTAPLEAELGAFDQLVRASWKEPSTDENLCMTEEQLAAFLRLPVVHEGLARLGERVSTTRATLDDRIKDLDRRLVVTLFASGTRRLAELGPDKQGFGLRAGWGRGLLDHTFNLDWTERQGLAGAADARSLKLGYEASGELSGAGFEGSKLSFFGAFERYSNVPEAKHRTIAKAGGKLDVRLADGLRLPLSVTWANHRDLLTDADEVVGNVALTLDLSDLRKKKTP